MNTIKPYEIKEIYPGHHFMMLDILDVSDVLKIISDDYKYLWFYNMEAYHVKWGKANIMFSDDLLNDTLIRNVNFECLLETSRIKNILNKLNCSISLVQLNEVPPSYMKMSKTTMSEKTKYDQLNKLGYLFNLYIPRPADYGWIISPNPEYLQKIVKIFAD